MKTTLCSPSPRPQTEKKFPGCNALAFPTQQDKSSRTSHNHDILHPRSLPHVPCLLNYHNHSLNRRLTPVYLLNFCQAGFLQRWPTHVLLFLKPTEASCLCGAVPTPSLTKKAYFTWFSILSFPLNSAPPSPEGLKCLRMYQSVRVPNFKIPLEPTQWDLSRGPRLNLHFGVLLVLYSEFYRICLSVSLLLQLKTSCEKESSLAHPCIKSPPSTPMDATITCPITKTGMKGHHSPQFLYFVMQRSCYRNKSRYIICSGHFIICNE